MATTPLLIGCGKEVPSPERPFPPVAGPAQRGWVDRPPLHWRKTAVKRRSFNYEIDEQVAHGGRRSARLSGTQLASGSVASLSQSLDASSLRGRTIRVRAWVRQQGIQQWAHMWAVTRDSTQRNLGAAREPEVGVRGTREWRPLEVELAIPESAETIAVGFVLLGPGTFWIDDVTLIDENDRPLAPRLRNADFEEVSFDDE